MNPKRVRQWLVYGFVRDARMYVMSCSPINWHAVEILHASELKALRQLERAEPDAFSKNGEERFSECDQLADSEYTTLLSSTGTQ